MTINGARPHTIPSFGTIERRPAPPLSRYMTKMRDALASFRDRADTRLDSWVNSVTGFGTARDKTTFGYVLPSRILTDEELSALYHSDDLAARMVDVIPQEMLREGFSVETGNTDLDTIISDKVEELELRSKLADGIRWARCFGGAALLIGADDGRDATKELRPERAKDLSYVYVIDRRLLWPISYYDEPGHPKLGQPKTFMVTTVGGYSYNTIEVHESRLVIFQGAPTGNRERLQLRGWNMSVMQRAHDVLRQFNTGWTAVETMMTDGNQAIFKVGGLTEMLAAGGKEMLRTRMEAMDMFRSVVRAIVIDADGTESFERHSVTFSEIPSVLDKFMLRLAAAVQIPVTILMGQSPAGMNATGESDFRWFYDRIRAEQTTMLGPKVRRIVDIWLKTKAGQEALQATTKKEPEALTVKFPPLWTETPLVCAQREYAIAQKDEVYIRSQVLIPEEVALSRFRPEGFQDNIQLSEEAIEAREASLESDLDDLSSLDDPDVSDVDVQKTLELTASDLATITKVNEARASVGLKPLPGADGNLTLPEFKAKYASTIAAGAQAEAGTDPEAEEKKPAPLPFGFGKPAAPPFGAPVGPTGPQGEEERQDAGPRTFELHRDVDETGVSGTGVVAEGCVFADGRVAVRWKTANASTTLFDSVEQMMKVHGHNGKTRVVYDK